MTATIIGISSAVFITVAGALLWAGTTALYNRYRSHSLWRALGAGGAVALLGMLGLTAIVGQSGDDGPGNQARSERPAPQPEVEKDEDEDGVVDAVDECPYEPGGEPTGCPDDDEDGLLDKQDRCPEEAAPTSDGCPARPRLTGLIDYAEEYGHEYNSTENAVLQQVTVAGIIDPRGVRMQVGGAYPSATFTVAVNRGFQWVRGRVGITSEPCSGGSVAYVSMRDAEGQPLWPKNGRPKTVHREAVSFKVRIASEDAVVLFAEAPETEGGYCGSSYATTEVGWVHPELISE